MNTKEIVPADSTLVRDSDVFTVCTDGRAKETEA